MRAVVVPWSVLQFEPGGNELPVAAILRPTGLIEKELAVGTGENSVRWEKWPRAMVDLERHRGGADPELTIRVSPSVVVESVFFMPWEMAAIRWATAGCLRLRAKER